MFPLIDFLHLILKGPFLLNIAKHQKLNPFFNWYTFIHLIMLKCLYLQNGEKI